MGLKAEETLQQFHSCEQEDPTMGKTSQKRAISNYRKRLHERGMARFEVLGLGGDRELIQSLAKRMADGGPDSARIRAAVRRTISGEPNRGGILNALRRSPLVGAELNFERPVIRNATKPSPSDALLVWMGGQADEDLFVSSISAVRRP